MKAEHRIQLAIRRLGGRVALMALVGLGLAPAAIGQATPSPREIVYAGDASFPPYEFLDADGRPAGLNIDLIRAVAREQGLSVRIRLEPWHQVRADLASGAADVASMYQSAQRAREVEFAVAHELVYHEVYVRRGSSAVRSLDDLRGRRILVEGGTFSADALSELGMGDQLLPQPSEPEALRALARGDGDAAVVTQAVNRPFADRAALNAEVIASGPPVLLAEYSFVTRKGRRDLIEQLNQGVAALKASGEYQRIYDRWIRSDHLSADEERALTWTLTAVAVVVLLVAVWNWALRRRVAFQTQALRQEFEARERAQAALAETERSLRLSQKMESVGRMAGGVAHDFNNILSVLLSYGTTLREDLIARGIPTDDLDEMLSASERATRLTRQLLAFSRATPVDAVPLDLCAVVTDMRALIQRLVGEHIHVEVVAAERPVIVEAEATQLEQILLNLAANARDAIPGAGTVRIAVQLRALTGEEGAGLPPGAYAALSVTDTGVGMDEATLARAFEPFFTTKAAGHGTGLGLATVLGQVERLHGKISVESAPGRGTTFRLLLPARTSVPAADVRSEPSPAVLPQRILLVEDDDALRRAARVALEGAGHHVEEARDGEEATALAGRTTISFLLTDVVMPRKSGPRLAVELRLQDPTIYVLFVSGYVQGVDRLDLDVPRTGYLAKPYTPRSLVEAVHRLVMTSAPAARPAAGAA